MTPNARERMPDAYFRKMYAEDRDPWGFEDRWYERRKYDLTLAALPRERYRSGFEPGCSIGVLTERLASRCDQLTAGDLLAEVAEEAGRRVAHLPHVTVGPLALPEAWPVGPFDLVVLSEVGYYLQERQLLEVLDRVDGTLVAGGHLVSAHWRGTTNYPLAGDEVHALIDARPTLRRLSRHLEHDFTIDVHERR